MSVKSKIYIVKKFISSGNKHLPTYLLTHPPSYLLTYRLIDIPTFLPSQLLTYLPTYPSIFLPTYLLYTRVSQKLLRFDSYLLCRLTYTNEIWHMHAMNCPASEYAIYKTMRSIDFCCLATEECEIMSCIHAGI